MTDKKMHAKNAMMGLAAGDSLSWTSMFHRSYQLPPWTRRLRREIDASSETTNVITVPMPFSLNQPASFFDICPADKTEWAAFTSKIILESSAGNYFDNAKNEWLKLSESLEPIRGSIAVQTALENLKKNILPPRSGKENPHYFDDNALARAVPIGICCSGDPGKAAEIAGVDSSITNSEDGIWAAQCIAAVISLTCSGEQPSDAVSAGYKFLPDSSWVKRTVTEALELSKNGDSLFSLLPNVQNKLINREYSYGIAAPETLAAALLIFLKCGQDFDKAVMTSLCFPKAGETLPAVTGALAGSLKNEDLFSGEWAGALSKLKGISIPSLTGINYVDLAEKISNYRI